MMPEQRWSAVRGSHRNDFALSSVSCISKTKKNKKCTLCGFVLLSFLITMSVNKQGGQVHRLRVSDGLLLSMIGSHCFVS